MNWSAFETPCLILDHTRLARNTSDMLARAEQRGVALRPHLKTAKSVDVAKLATGGRMSGLTVSTLKEADYFAQAGFDDILVACGTAPGKLNRAAAIRRDTGKRVTLVTDNVEIARAIAAFSPSSSESIDILIEIDSGQHRAGCAPDAPEVSEIAQVLLNAPHVNLRGVMTHAGHSYGANDRKDILRIAEEERVAAVTAADRLRAMGAGVDIVSMGSTPTTKFAEDLSGITEVRAGVHVFYDLDQASRSVCVLDEIALSVLATVIGYNEAAGHVLVDAGALALSKDLGANAFMPDAGYGYVCDPDTAERLGGLSVTAVNQEHGMIPIGPEWRDRLHPGAQVRILPNHACMTAAAYDRYFVQLPEEGWAEWPRINGW